jgi:hypothetical protein
MVFVCVVFFTSVRSFRFSSMSFSIILLMSPFFRLCFRSLSSACSLSVIVSLIRLSVIFVSFVVVLVVLAYIYCCGFCFVGFGLFALVVADVCRLFGSVDLWLIRV